MAGDGIRDMQDVSVRGYPNFDAGADTATGNLVGLLGILGSELVPGKSSESSTRAIPAQSKAEDVCAPFNRTRINDFMKEELGSNGRLIGQKELLELMIKRADQGMDPNGYDGRLKFVDLLMRALKENKQVQQTPDGKLILTSTPATPDHRIQLHQTTVNNLYKFMDQIRLRGCLSDMLRSSGDTSEAERLDSQVARMRERMQQGRNVEGKSIVPNQLIDVELNLLTRDMPRTTDANAREAMRESIRNFQLYKEKEINR